MLRFLLDEDLRGPLWQAILRHNLQGLYPLDVIRVGDLAELPRGSSDPSILDWAMTARRIVISADRSTMQMHLQDHIQSGRSSPGLLLVRPQAGVPEVLEFLIAAAYASEPGEWIDQCRFIP